VLKENLVISVLKEKKASKRNVPKILNSSKVTKGRKEKRATWACEGNQVKRVNQD